MNRTVLQIPMDRSLRKQAERAAEEQGFSTLQDFTRLVYHKLVEKRLEVQIGEPYRKLSPRAAKRYEKMDRDIKSGKVKLKSFDSVKALMEDLTK